MSIKQMNIFQRLSFRFFGLVLALLIPVLLAVTLHFSHRTYEQFIEQRNGTVERVAKAYASNLAESLWRLDESQIDTTMATMFALESELVDSLEITNEQGEVIRASNSELDSASHGETKTLDFPLQFGSRNRLHDLGTLSIGVTFPTFSDHFKKVYQDSVWVMLGLILLVGVVFGIAFYFTVHRRLVNLQATMQQVKLVQKTKGEIAFDGVNLSSSKGKNGLMGVVLPHDEIDSLEDSLIEMRTRLSENFRKLQKATKDTYESEKRLFILSRISESVSQAYDTELALRVFSRLVVPEFCDWIVYDHHVSADHVQRLHAYAGQDSTMKAPKLEFLQAPHEGSYEEGAETLVEFNVKSEKLTSRIAIEEDQKDLLEATFLQADSSAAAFPVFVSRKFQGYMWVGGFNKREVDTEFFSQLVSQLSRTIERNRLHEQSSASLRSRDNLLSLVSHELKTPLTSIVGWSSVLLESAEKTQIRPASDPSPVNEIAKHADTLSRLVDDLLGTAMQAEGRFELSATILDVVALCGDTIKSLKNQLELKKVKLETEFPSAPVLLLGDVEKIRRLLWHLIHNAIRFNRTPGFVKVHLHEEGSNLQLIVSDEGLGIPEEKLNSLFDRFSHSNEEVTSTRSGLGLGLSLSRDICLAHGGTIDIRSHVDKGTQVTVQLPLYSHLRLKNAEDQILNQSS